MRHITPAEAQAALTSDKSTRLIDVRTGGEFASIHATAAVNIPLDEIERRTGEFAGATKVLLICRTGKRAAMACEKLEKISGAGGEGRFAVIEGGTDGWAAAGLPVARGKGVISLERQVRIVAGGLALAGSLLAWFVHPAWVAMPGFIGAGLMFAGITDTCGMAMMLSRMPWNRSGGAKRSCSTA
jgi:rhodanese-related sulfurtransferase